MNKVFFQEMHQLSHEDDLRYRLLIRGVKQMLEERKRGRYNLLRRLEYRKLRKEVQAKKWS